MDVDTNERIEVNSENDVEKNIIEDEVDEKKGKDIEMIEIDDDDDNDDNDDPENKEEMPKDANTEERDEKEEEQESKDEEQEDKDKSTAETKETETATEENNQKTKKKKDKGKKEKVDQIDTQQFTNMRKALRRKVRQNFIELETLGEGTASAICAHEVALVRSPQPVLVKLGAVKDETTSIKYDFTFPNYFAKGTSRIIRNREATYAYVVVQPKKVWDNWDEFRTEEAVPLTSHDVSVINHLTSFGNVTEVAGGWADKNRHQYVTVHIIARCDDSITLNTTTSVLVELVPVQTSGNKLPNGFLKAETFMVDSSVQSDHKILNEFFCVLKEKTKYARLVLAPTGRIVNNCDFLGVAYMLNSKSNNASPKAFRKNSFVNSLAPLFDMIIEEDGPDYKDMGHPVCRKKNKNLKPLVGKSPRERCRSYKYEGYFVRSLIDNPRYRPRDQEDPDRQRRRSSKGDPSDIDNFVSIMNREISNLYVYEEKIKSTEESKPNNENQEDKANKESIDEAIKENEPEEASTEANVDKAEVQPSRDDEASEAAMKENEDIAEDQPMEDDETDEASIKADMSEDPSNEVIEEPTDIASDDKKDSDENLDNADEEASHVENEQELPDREFHLVKRELPFPTSMRKGLYLGIDDIMYMGHIYQESMQFRAMHAAAMQMQQQNMMLQDMIQGQQQFLQEQQQQQQQQQQLEQQQPARKNRKMKLQERREANNSRQRQPWRQSSDNQVPSLMSVNIRVDPDMRGSGDSGRSRDARQRDSRFGAKQRRFDDDGGDRRRNRRDNARQDQRWQQGQMSEWENTQSMVNPGFSRRDFAGPRGFGDNGPGFKRRSDREDDFGGKQRRFNEKDNRVADQLERERNKVKELQAELQRVKAEKQNNSAGLSDRADVYTRRKQEDRNPGKSAMAEGRRSWSSARGGQEDHGGRYQAEAETTSSWRNNRGGNPYQSAAGQGGSGGRYQGGQNSGGQYQGGQNSGGQYQGGQDSGGQYQGGQDGGGRFQGGQDGGGRYSGGSYGGGGYDGKSGGGKYSSRATDAGHSNRGSSSYGGYQTHPSYNQSQHPSASAQGNQSYSQTAASSAAQGNQPPSYNYGNQSQYQSKSDHYQSGYNWNQSQQQQHGYDYSQGNAQTGYPQASAHAQAGGYSQGNAQGGYSQGNAQGGGYSQGNAHGGYSRGNEQGGGYPAPGYGNPSGYSNPF